MQKRRLETRVMPQAVVRVRRNWNQTGRAIPARTKEDLDAWDSRKLKVSRGGLKRAACIAGPSPLVM
jgi:hypothetical protein